MVAALSDELSRCIARCADALGDVPRLKTELHALRATGDGIAHFATALFELELARQGDADSRANLSHLAEMLLLFWRDGSGDSLARVHPALDELWKSVAPMLVQFELKRFELDLTVCWKARSDTRALKAAIQELAPDGHKRVEFARCLYHLELARQGVDSSRAEFAKRAQLLADAYQDESFANDLIGHDAGLLHLWGELKPYLDEFFETMEEAAHRAQEDTRRVKMPVPPEAAELTEPATPALPPPLPVAKPPPPSAPPPGAPSSTVVAQPDTALPPIARPLPAGGPNPPPVLHAVSAPPVLQAVPPPPPQPSAPRGPPPAPGNLTPPGAWVPDADLIIEEAVEAPPPPPRTQSGEVEIVDAEEAPPPPPAVTPSHGLEAVLDVEEVADVELDPDPDPAALEFWNYTFASLQLAPTDGVRTRMLATESRPDRKRLTTWLEGLGPHLAVPQARAFASLVRLMLAGETKEKSLFGQSNPRRKEALQGAFSLLVANPDAAGQAAVWFELDGPQTIEALQRGLELLVPFLAFCAREALDPLSPQAVAKYLS